MLMGNSNRSLIRNEKHVLIVGPDGDDLNVELVCPITCMDNDCVLRFEIDYCGLGETLFGYHDWMDRPLNHLNGLAHAVAAVAERISLTDSFYVVHGDTAVVPFGFEWSSWRSYEGEYDSELEVWAL